MAPSARSDFGQPDDFPCAQATSRSPQGEGRRWTKLQGGIVARVEAILETDAAMGGGEVAGRGAERTGSRVVDDGLMLTKAQRGH